MSTPLHDLAAQQSNELLAQYDQVLQSLNQQVQKLLTRNQELEQTQLANELLVQQSNNVVQDLQQQLQLEKHQKDQLKLEHQELSAEYNKHRQALQIYAAEMDMLRNVNFELEQRCNTFQQ